MRIHILILSFILISFKFCSGQSESITNIRVRFDTTGRIRVLYDLNRIQSGDSVYMEAKGRQTGALTIRTVEGDIGKNQLTGRNKRIYWSIVKDGYLIDEDVQISILIKPTAQTTVQTPSPPTIGGGPANALLSAVLPGIGNIFVQPKTKKHRLGLRPLLPIAFYGLAGFSIYRWKQAQDRYAVYNQQIREEVAQPIYDDANSMRHQAILIAGAAATIWAIDVGCTLSKGIKNNKDRQRSVQRLSLGIMNDTPIIGLSINL